MRELNPIPLILTAIASVCATVAVLGFYGYLHFAKPEDALLLSDFTMLKTVEGEDYKVSLEPASQVAQCIDNVLVLFDTEQRGLSGVLVNNKKRAVRCIMSPPTSPQAAEHAEHAAPQAASEGAAAQ